MVAVGHGDGEVDGDVGARQVLGVEGVPHVQAGHELEPLGVFHRLADGRSHAPGGAHNSYANRHGPTIAIGVHVKRDSTEPAAHKYQPKAMFEGSTTLQSQLLVLKQAHDNLMT